MKSYGILAMMACAAFASSAATLAFYPGEEGTAGQPVTTLVNKVAPGTYDGTALQGGSEEAGWGDMPSYVDTVSGNAVYSDTFCTQLVACAPLAVSFSTSQGAESATGGYVDLANLAQTLGGKKKFTFEFFWRAIGGRSREQSLAGFCNGMRLSARTSYEYQATPGIEGNSSSWRMGGAGR